MANAVFSPKDFKVWLIEETTTGNANGATPNAPAITGSMYQLDVDSVSFPSFNMNQVANVRSQTGRVVHVDDWFQDNDIRATEISLSGTWHNDGGHVTLAHSVCGNNLAPNSIADATVSATATGKSGAYGTAETEKTFTLVLAPPDYDDGKNIILVGCLVTNFQLNADMGTDGGQYKWSCTISSGRVPQLGNGQTAAGAAYSGTHVDMSGIDISATKVMSVNPVLSAFSIAIDSPAIYTGVAEGAGYHSFGRGEEIAVTASATVKYDSVTRGLLDTFAGSTNQEHDAADCFTITQTTATATSIAIPCGVMTNVAFNEGDAMMLDVEMKALSDGSTAVLTIDLA